VEEVVAAQRAFLAVVVRVVIEPVQELLVTDRPLNHLCFPCLVPLIQSQLVVVALEQPREHLLEIMEATQYLVALPQTEAVKEGLTAVLRIPLVGLLVALVVLVPERVPHL
jgi:hypothetical protein